MIKRYWFVPVLIVVIIAAAAWLRTNHSKQEATQIPSAQSVPVSGAPAGPSLPDVKNPPAPSRDEKKLTIDGKKVVGLPPGKEKETFKDLRVMNRPSALWEENLMSTMKTQAGDKAQSISVEKVDSFVWVNDGIALFVESVKITARNQSNMETSFRALVDAQNGKILQTWDRPVVENYRNSEENFLKVDPRYPD